MRGIEPRPQPDSVPGREPRAQHASGWPGMLPSQKSTFGAGTAHLCGVCRRVHVRQRRNPTTLRPGPQHKDH